MTRPKQQIDAQALQDALAEEIRQMTEQVAEAVTQAGEDDVIGHSEHQVRDALGAFRTRVFERAVQMRIDAAEAAFSPSAEPGRAAVPPASQGPAQPGGADGQRGDPG
jgi:N-methylhydantoinase B/oxoprolinase/acetone carboxylase alpha subunit